MRERGKAKEEEQSSYSNYTDYYYSSSSSSSDLRCRKHPSSSSVGICAYCLKDRLVKLVCSDCGEQRLSSCSCSEISSNRNSCTFEVGSVGRVSFLIENERNLVSHSFSKPKFSPHDKNDDKNVVLLKRSNSSSVEIKRSATGLWKIRRFFKKNRAKQSEKQSVSGFDDKNDIIMFDCMGISRSRSLCSFRGSGVFGSEDNGDLVFSGARSSVSGARTSSVNGGLIFDSGRRSGFSETEPRKSGFDCAIDSENGLNLPNKRVFSLKESDFNGGDEHGFIDFKLDFASELKTEQSGPKMGVLKENENMNIGGSCRITVSDDKCVKKGRRSLKAWRWIFKNSANSGGGRKKYEEIDMCRR